MNINKYIVLLITAGLVLMQSCATKNAPIVKQTYHDLTGHYNAYFNANELYNANLKTITDAREENYDQIIALYPYGYPGVDATNADFNIIKSKLRKNINKHAISNWTDNSFLLFGKAHLFSGDVDSAVHAFRFVTNYYTEGVDGRNEKQIKKHRFSKKRKKKAKKKEAKLVKKEKEGKDIRPKSKLLVHEPSKTKALLWMVKAFLAKEDYSKAYSAISYARTDDQFLQNFDWELDLINADYHIRQNEYGKAISYLENSIAGIKKQKKKTRYQFVLAQLYESKNDYNNAVKWYKESKKKNPDFEMVFYANFKTAKLGRKGGIERKQTEKLLAKLLKEGKNEDYYDQLYYEKAVMALEVNKTGLAKQFLKKSVATSTFNVNQKASSYKLLAELFYDEEEYTTSKLYYDSALAIITEERDDYNTIAMRSNTLSKLVENNEILANNSELLRLSNLSEKELKRELYDKAEAQIEADIKAAEDKANADLLALKKQDETNTGNSKWYFYSETAKKKGFSDFQKKWGNRPLEDDWRRANKNSLSDTEETETEEISTDDKIDELYASLLADIPTKPAQIKTLENQNIQALYNNGLIYRMELNNTNKAIQTFKTLLKEYPKNRYEAESLYNLYLLYNEANETAKANEYKNKVLNLYPESTFAKLIKDPNYKGEIANLSENASQLYEATYQMYLNKNYSGVVSNVKKALNQYKNHPLEPKFKLLEALTLGYQDKYNDMVGALKHLVDNYQGTEERDKAEEMLVYLGEIEGKNTEKTPTENKPTETNKEETESLINETKPKDNGKGGFKINLGNKEFNINKKNKQNSNTNPNEIKEE